MEILKAIGKGILAFLQASKRWIIGLAITAIVVAIAASLFSYWVDQNEYKIQAANTTQIYNDIIRLNNNETLGLSVQQADAIKTQLALIDPKSTADQSEIIGNIVKTLDEKQYNYLLNSSNKLLDLLVTNICFCCKICIP
jgi:hypothetical protein